MPRSFGLVGFAVLTSALPRRPGPGRDGIDRVRGSSSLRPVMASSRRHKLSGVCHIEFNYAWDTRRHLCSAQGLELVLITESRNCRKVMKVELNYNR